MAARIFALVIGLVFLALGVCGFVPSLLVSPTGFASLGMTSGYGLLFGLFPVNALRDMLHLFFGIWGVVVWRVTAASRSYARAVAAVFAVLALLGVFPGLSSLFGAMPLWGHNIWLNALFAAAGAIVGYTPRWAMRRGPQRG